MIGKIKGIGGVGESKINVFAQLAEPKVKDGIWIKTEETIINEPKYNEPIPYKTYGSKSVVIDNDIYLFNIARNDTTTVYIDSVYKYNILTNTYTKLKDCPMSTVYVAVVVDTNIYLFGDTYAYMYNTLKNTYTKLKDLPEELINSSAILYNGAIYIFGLNSSSQNKMRRYNISENTYNLFTIPYNFIKGSTVIIDDDVYLLGGTNSQKTNYKYNPLTNTYTKLADIPYSYYGGSAIAIDNDIYLVGGNATATKGIKTVYKYDTLTGTYTKLEDIPYNFHNGSVVAVDSDIYLFGGDTNGSTINYKYRSYEKYPQINNYQYNEIIATEQLPATPENDSIYIIYGDTYVTKLLEQLILNFSNVQLYKNNENQPYPIYYGNGEEWVKILN